MRKHLVSVALFAVMATLTVGCQKEDFTEQNPAVSEKGVLYTVNYFVDGVAQQAVLYSDTELVALYESLMTLASQGHAIFIEGNGNGCMATKDVQTYVTSDRLKAMQWAMDMSMLGYNVNVICRDGTYTVIASKTEE